MNLDRQHILNSLALTLSEFIEEVNQLNKISIDDFSSKDSLVVMIDMINGFCKFGPLSSPYVDDMIPNMSHFLDNVIKNNITIVSYRDAHPEDASEFNFFPKHCVANTPESELVPELVRKELIDVSKNSTNGFLSQNPLELVPNKNIKNIFVIGCVTDICVKDFTSTMIKHLQDINQDTDLYLIENLVDTFDIPGIHDRQTEHTLALYQLKNMGVKLVRI